MFACKRQVSWVNVLAITLLLFLSLSSSSQVFAKSIEPRPAEAAASAPGDFNKTGPANGLTINTPTFTWTASAGATGYQYCVDTTDDNACYNNLWWDAKTNLTVTPTNLSGGPTYYWQVRAGDGAGNYTYANGGQWWSFKSVLPGNFDKTAPSSGTKQYDKNITLSWSASTDATAYKYCIDTSNNDFCGATWTDVGTALQAPPPSLVGGTTYYWHVVAFDGFVKYTESNSGNWWSFTASPPDAFKKKTPTNGMAVNTVFPTFSWEAAAGAKSYSICIDTINDNQCNTTWTYRGTDINFKPPRLLDSQTYYWQVRATGDFGDTDADSAWFSFRTDTIPFYLPFITREEN